MIPAMTSTTGGADADRRRGIGFSTAGLTGLHYAAMGLAAITGVIHLYLYYVQGFAPFLLASLGFFGAIGLILVLPAYRPWLYLVGIPYTLVQMAGWIAAGMPDFVLGVVDKVVQVALIALLVVLYRRERGSGAARSTSDDASVTAE